jgi:hypothetical protein
MKRWSQIYDQSRFSLSPTDGLKACVLFQIGILGITDFKLDLIAQLFNPDWLLREVSAWALHKIHPDSYEQNAKRLGEEVKRQLDALIIQSKRMTRFERVLFFQKLAFFENVPGLTLSYLADISEEIHLKENDSLSLDEKLNNNFYIIVTGVVEFFQKGNHVSNFQDGQFIGEMLALPNFVSTNLVIAKSKVVVLKFNKDQFYELVADNVKLADRVLEFI